MDFEITQAIEVLSQTPSSLWRMLGGLSDEWTASSGDENDWAPYDVIGHLIHAEKTDWIPRAEIILAQGEDRAFKPFDRLAQFGLSDDRSLEDLLGEFAQMRSLSIESLLRWQLTPDQLTLTGIHPEFGEVALDQLLATWVVHDLTHIRQIATWMAKRYAEAVGPWRAYLSILQ